MSEIEQAPMFGAVENNKRLPVIVGAFSGMAGVRQRENGREVAYIGDAPRRFPMTIKIDGVDAQAAERMPSDVPGFTRLWVPDAV